MLSKLILSVLHVDGMTGNQNLVPSKNQIQIGIIDWSWRGFGPDLGPEDGSFLPKMQIIFKGAMGHMAIILV